MPIAAKKGSGKVHWSLRVPMVCGDVGLPSRQSSRAGSDCTHGREQCASRDSFEGLDPVRCMPHPRVVVLCGPIVGGDGDSDKHRLRCFR